MNTLLDIGYAVLGVIASGFALAIVCPTGKRQGKDRKRRR